MSLHRHSAQIICGIIGLLLILLAVQTAQAATITVGGACTLILAIQEANTSGASGGACVAGAAGADTIVLASGATYNLTAGPFAADGNNGLPSITSTITITGNGATITRTGGGNFRIFHIAASGNLTVNNVTVSNGAEVNGAGLYNLGILVLNNCVITGNSAQIHGGGIYSSGNNSNITISASTIGGTLSNRAVTGGGGGIFNTGGGQVFIQNNSFISGNNAAAGGGGIYNESLSSLLTIVNSTIGGASGNQVTLGSGGGITNELSAQLSLQNSTISGNTAAAGGGGIYNGDGRVTIDSSIIGGVNPNIALSQNGGGLWNNINGVMLLQNGTQVSNNTAAANSGGIFNAGVLTINASSLVNNQAGFGGAIYNNLEGTVRIENNSLISGNRATSITAGGIFNYGALVIDASQINLNTVNGDGGGILTGSNTGFPASVSITNNSRVVGNSATGQGGGIFNLGGTGLSTITITNSVFESNTAAQGGAIYNLSNSSQIVIGSCVIGNSATSIFNAAATTLNATGNWWNAMSGPSGAGPGTGDSVNANVNFAGFLTAPPLSCNQSPVANNDVASTPQGIAVVVNVLANDTDADGTLNPTTVTVVSVPANGTVTSDPVTGAITYTPNPTFAGTTDTFTYTVQDNDGATSNIATVIITIGVGVLPTAIPVASGDGSAFAPAICSDLNSQSTSNLRVHVPSGTVTDGDVYCRILVRDGVYVQDSSEVGRQTVIDLGIIQAVDLFGLRPRGESAPDFNNPIKVCLAGRGNLLYLNAITAPRVLQPVPSAIEGAYTCASIPDAGTVVLIGTSATPSNAAEQELQNCRITTTHAVRLRAEPGTASVILTTLPYDITLTATKRLGGWFNVIYLDGQGWVSADYLDTVGSCG
jgi:Bacterial Ig domain/Bacterial SH3 domain